MANIIIDSVKIIPNPVDVGSTFTISVGIIDKVYAILDTAGKYIMEADGKAIEFRPKRGRYALLTEDGKAVLDAESRRIIINKLGG